MPCMRWNVQIKQNPTSTGDKYNGNKIAERKEKIICVGYQMLTKIIYPLRIASGELQARLCFCGTLEVTFKVQNTDISQKMYY